MNILYASVYFDVLFIYYLMFLCNWQPQQKDVIKALPKPLPASMVASYLSNKKEDEKDEDEKEEVGFSFLVNFLF